ncbi:hypothetical protein RJ639_012590, partial [Escallonia herrerae]
QCIADVAFFFSFFRLSLVATIKDRAREMYKRLEEQKCTRGRNLEALAAGCLFFACRQEGKPRTIKEICSVANGASKKEIGRAKEFIVKQLAVEMGQSMELGATSAGDYLRRFCSNLSKEVKAVQEAVQKSEAIDIRYSYILPSQCFATDVSCTPNLLIPLHAPSLALRTLAASASNRTLRQNGRPPKSIAGAIIYMITQLSDEKKSLTGLIVPNWYASDKDLINNRSARPL